MHRIANSAWIVVLAAGMTSAVHAGQVSFVTQAPCDTVVNSISPDARYAAVRTCTDVFFVDRQTGTSAMVSHAAGSTTLTGAGSSGFESVSPDGRYVGLTSNASNLVAGQTGGGLNVFLYDRVTDTTILVSHQHGAPATAGNGLSDRPSVSAAGRYIAFDSLANDLAAGVSDTASSLDTYVYDRDTATATLVSHAANAPNVAAGSSYSPKISADGAFVAFSSSSSDHMLRQESNSGLPDLFLFDRVSGAIVLVTRSHELATREADDGFYADSGEWFVDDDGSHVVFTSSASDLVAGDTAVKGVFAFDNGLKGRFYTLTPCRLLDTRQPADGPALGPEIELLSLHCRCGIPATAKALAVNATVLGPSSFGHLSLYPGDAVPPATSLVNFGAGQTRSNNAILPLATNADGTAAAWAAVTGGGTLHLLLDVMGYFE